MSLRGLISTQEQVSLFNPHEYESEWKQIEETIEKSRSLNIYDTLIEISLDRNRYDIIKYYYKLVGNSSIYNISAEFEGDKINEIIDWCVNELPKNHRGICSVYINGDINIDKLLKNGLVPALYHYKMKSKLSELLKYVDYADDIVHYWMLSDYDSRKILSEYRVWSMLTEKKILSYGGESLIKYTYPNNLYSSNRIKTTMSLFRTPYSKIGVRKDDSITSSNEKYYEIITPIKNVNYTLIGYFCIPVTRYAKNINSGLYYPEGQINRKFCGTFYYYEPESTTFLIGKKILIAETKCSAAMILNLQNLYLPYLSESKINEKWQYGEYREDLIYTSSEAHQIGLHDYIETYKIKHGKVLMKNIEEITQTPIYVGFTSGLYAAEDNFDQPLCLAATKAGYDLLIFTRMVGQYQIVTEVLDVRKRSESWDSLIYT